MKRIGDIEYEDSSGNVFQDLGCKRPEMLTIKADKKMKMRKKLNGIRNDLEKLTNSCDIETCSGCAYLEYSLMELVELLIEETCRIN